MSCTRCEQSAFSETRLRTSRAEERTASPSSAPSNGTSGAFTAVGAGTTLLCCAVEKAIPNTPVSSSTATGFRRPRILLLEFDAISQCRADYSSTQMFVEWLFQCWVGPCKVLPVVFL